MPVVELAKRWKSLIDLFTGGDSEIIKASERFHAENPDNALNFGLDGQLYAYIRLSLSD